MSELITEGRKLVTVRKINAIEPIPNADAIEVAIIDGWNVVIKKGEFNVGNYCVFFEIDSFLPATDGRFAFLAGKGTKTDEKGTERLRLKTIKLRGQISQGLALPVNLFWDDLVSIIFNKIDDDPSNIEAEVKQLLEELNDNRWGIEQFINVTKYERPEEREGNSGGNAKAAGAFPIVIPKTDEERIQNVFGKFRQTMQGVSFRKSLKLDGSSQTIAFFSNPDFYVEKVSDKVQQWDEELKQLTTVQTKPYPFESEEGQIIVCSRNLVLKFDESSSFWKAALKHDIPSRLKDYCVYNNRQLALQGECMGPGIQGNREKLEDHEFYCFRIWDVDAQNFLDDSDFLDVTNTLGISIVPQGDIIDFFNEYDTINSALESAEHKSINHPVAEGDVYKSITKVNGQTIHFKIINNKFLIKCED